MKKFLSLLSVFLILLVMMPTTPVNAASTAKEVIFGAVVKNVEGTYSSLYAVRQSMFKEGGNPEVKASFLSGSVNVSNTLCNKSEQFNNWDRIYDRLCSVKDGEANRTINPMLAYVSVTEDGEVSLYMQNEITLKNLSIYYSIAGPSSVTDAASSLVFCKSGEAYKLCQHAQYVESANISMTGSWKSKSRRGSGQMFFQHHTLEAGGFTSVMVDSYTGATSASGFNVIDNMTEAEKRLAMDYGAYIIVTMSIAHTYDSGGNQVVDTYYVNTSSITNNKYTDVVHIAQDGTSVKTFANISGNAKNHSTDGDSIYNARYREMNTNDKVYVDRYAALVSKTAKVAEENEGLVRMLALFDEYVKPIVEIALGVLLVVKGTMLIVTIVKSSDEPEVRKDSIKHLVTLFISVFVIMLIIWYAKDFVEILQTIISGDL